MGGFLRQAPLVSDRFAPRSGVECQGIDNGDTIMRSKPPATPPSWLQIDDRNDVPHPLEKAARLDADQIGEQRLVGSYRVAHRPIAEMARPIHNGQLETLQVFVI